jgi:MFS family permease
MSSTTAGATAAPAVRHPAIALVLLGLLAALQGADPNVASTALVGAARGIGIESLSFAASISTLALAATAITTGLLADAFGRRRVLQLGLLVVVAGDLLVFLAPAPPVYLTGRALAGIGLGAVYGAAFAYIRVVARPGQQAAAMGAWTSVMMFGMLAMTFAGGLLSQIDWRVAFLVIPAVGLLGFFLVPVFLPVEPPTKPASMDVIGQVLLALGIVALLAGISNIGSGGILAYGGIGAGVVLLTAWVVTQLRNPNAFFPVRIFANPIFLAAMTAGLIFNIGNAVAFLQLTNLWQYVNGLTTSEVSVWQLPLLLATVAFGIVTGRLMSRGLPVRLVILGGGLIAAVGFVVTGLLHGGTSFWAFVPGSVLIGAGIVIASVPYGSLILQSAPAKYFGPVSSSRLTIGQFFYALGFALATIVVDALTRGGTIDRLTAAGVAPTQTGSALDAVRAYAAQSTAPTTSLGKEALGDALDSYGLAFATMMYVTAAIMALSGVLGFWLVTRGQRATAAAPANSTARPPAS